MSVYLCIVLAIVIDWSQTFLFDTVLTIIQKKNVQSIMPRHCLFGVTVYFNIQYRLVLTLIVTSYKLTVYIKNKIVYLVTRCKVPVFSGYEYFN